MKKYEEVLQYIRNRIESGALTDGCQLETEEQLASLFSCSRPTVRQATGLLEQEGLLQRISGKGTFVTVPKITQEYTHFIESYALSLQKHGHIPKTEVLDFHLETADPYIRQKMGLSEKDKVFYLKRLRYALTDASENKPPLLLTEVFLPAKYLPQFEQNDFEVVSLYQVLQQYGLYPQHATRYIEAKMPDARTAAILQMPQSEPIQVITSISKCGEHIIEYSRSIYPASRNRFIVEINR